MRSITFLAAVTMFFSVTSLFAQDDEVVMFTRQLIGTKLNERTSAARMLGEIGPAAASSVTSLIKCLEDQDPELRHEVAVALGRIGSAPKQVIPALTPLLSNEIPILRHSAIDAIRQFGTDAQASVPALMKLLDDKEALIRISAARAIAEIEIGRGKEVPQATNVLIAGLKHPNHHVSSEAIHGLAVVGSAAVPGIQELVGGPDSQACENACDALAAIGPASTIALERLEATVKSPDHGVCCHAIHALGEIGPAAGRASPFLVNQLSNSDSHVRFAAEQALMKIGKPAIPSLIGSLNTTGIQQTTARILAGIGADSREAVPGLTNLLDSKENEVRREAILALAAIGPDAKTATPQLTKLFSDKQYPNRPAVAFALGKICAKEAIPQLKQALEVKDNPVLRLASAWALLQLDPMNDDYVTLGVPILTASLQSEIPEVRREGALSLGRIGVRAKSAVPELTLRLKDDNPGVRREALVALAEIGPDSASAVSEIALLLETGEMSLRPIVCYALGRIGAAAIPAVPQLQRILFSRDPHEKTVAAWALVNISPDQETVKTAIPLLATALTSAEQPNVRLEAARTLGKIGKDSAAAKEALRFALKDPDEAVRQAAEQAMK